MFYADLHVHSKYSRATSRDADLEHLAIWARRKGITVVGTGDFTHPQWWAELKDKLVPAEPGLFRLRDDLQREVDRQVAPTCEGVTRFLLEVEVSTIHKKLDKTRKVHHLLYAPDFEQAGRIVERLARIGNLASDGRPILGLDPRHLLEITLDGGPGCFLIPAHIWTPWFAVLGSQSGFDTIADCYGDLTPHLFAMETGLSSDPPMNWRLSQLDRYTLVSNSDAHSPPKLGREACGFDTDLSYFAIRRALETREGYAGTVEFFPEEGKYHLDGHRACGVRFEPADTERQGGLCPACGKRLTVGVMNRVQTLADRPDGYSPAETDPFRSFVPLPEMLAEIRGVGEASRGVQAAYDSLLAKVGSELFILEQADVADLRRAASPTVAEAIRRMRDGQVIRQAGYDGEYGVIRLFDENELRQGACVGLLFEMEREPAEPRECPPETLVSPPVALPVSQSPPPPQLAGLDPDQAVAASLLHGPLLILAGPGTGKTRTLTHRLARLVTDGGAAPEQCLAVTFSRRAATELSERLVGLLGPAGERVPVMTLHALGLSILREHAASIGLAPDFRVLGDEERQSWTAASFGLSERDARRLLRDASRSPRLVPDEAQPAVAAYVRALRANGLVDFDDLLALPTEWLEAHPEVAAAYRARWPWVSIDEFQDLDAVQLRLVRQLASTNGTASHVCAIGDPDQSIYGFRGAVPEAFRRFADDFPGTRVVSLTRNYRSAPAIVASALAAIAPSSLVPDRKLTPTSTSPQRLVLHEAPSDRAEAEFVVQTIERLVGGASLFSFDSGRVATHAESPCSFADFAVLYRAEAVSEPLAEALSRAGIPFQRKSHRRLADSPDVQALLRVLRDEPAAETAEPLSVVDRLKRAADTVWPERPDVVTCLTELHPLAVRCGCDLGTFLTELTLGSDVDLWDPRADRVSLLTLHAAKGLEFPVVFLIGCEDGVLPLRFGSEDENVDEERRLFFVGLTRARERLIVSHSRRRLWRGQLRESAPSPFLAAIPPALFEREVARPISRPRPSHSQLALFE